MKKFLILCLLFVSIPLVPLIGSYILFDPFKVLWHYENYYVEGDGGSLNRNFVSTMNYLNKKEKYDYDSFILGNSRSLFYFVNDWKKYIAPNSKCYHFSESGGSVNGIYYKLKLIDENNAKIRNALLVFDTYLLSELELDNGYLFATPPALKDNNNFLEFHYEHFMQWTDLKFLWFWLEYRITGEYKSYMDDYIAKGTNYKYYNPVTNEEPLVVQDSLIALGLYYDKERTNEFRDKQHPSVHPVISKNEAIVERLRDIYAILHKHGTKYKVIISPMYNQEKLNPCDYRVLCDIFGAENVFDFSGINDWTKDYHNYYEPSHYRPTVASDIMRIIYKKKVNCNL